MMSKIHSLFVALILTFFVGCSSSSQGVANFDPHRPAVEAKIEGKSYEYKVKEKNINYLQSLPAPELLFVFESADNRKVELPEAAKEILAQYWKDTVRLRFEAAAAPNEDFTRKWIAVIELHSKIDRAIRDVEFDAPGGKRKISERESGGILKFINYNAYDIIEQAARI